MKTKIEERVVLIIEEKESNVNVVVKLIKDKEKIDELIEYGSNFFKIILTLEYIDVSDNRKKGRKKLSPVEENEMFIFALSLSSVQFMVNSQFLLFRMR
jgi:hypothetical protein